MKMPFVALLLSLLLISSGSSGNSTTEASRASSAAAEGALQPEDAEQVLVPGPDVVVGDLSQLQQFGNAGTQVGLALAPTSCNAGNSQLNFFVLPNTDHPVIAQNLFRMSGGPTNSDRLEQIGQSWVKHTFGADQNDACSYGCIPAPDATTLGPGCSDPYDASTGAAYTRLGSRAWINPFTGVFASTANQHTGHTHTGTSHRLVVEGNDLLATAHPGATYYAEVQYITPHEYAWCQTHPGECNMYNNTSYRRFNVSGTSSFTFSAVGQTVRKTPVIYAWTGATITRFEPAPGADGHGFIGSKVTGPVNGIWHYEYAIQNENLDRAIQSFAVPLGCGVTVSDAGFRASANPPAFASDGTLNNAGYSNAAWSAQQSPTAISWNSEPFAQNQNANALRWGTLYNFRFDSNRPPQAINATLGFFKTGAPLTVQIQGPAPAACNALQVVSAVSRKNHGAAGEFDIALPMSGEPAVESRASGGAHTVVVTFSNPVASGQASVTAGIGSVAGSPTFSDQTMTLQLSGVADLQTLTILLSNVTDSFSQVLPETAVRMTTLVGDTNANKMVNASDLGLTKAASGLPLTPENFRADVNVSGTVTASDITQVKATAGNSVP